MKIAFKIARAELRNLFYSPVAWFLAIVFLVQCAVAYAYALFPRVRGEEIDKLNNPRWKPHGVHTKSIFYSFAHDRLFDVGLQNLYLFIPLLTMGVISRETNNGTIRLLYSSPVKLRQLVLGKYLALLLYNFLLLLIMCIFIVSGFFHIKSLDYPMLLSSALAFYLVVCAYTAIGVYMSSLTHYQIISGIGSFLIIFILTKIGGLWQQYDFVRDLTYFLAINGRTDKMLHGLITTKDVLYFVVIAYIFLGFTLIRLRAGRESRPWWVNGGRYLLVLSSALMIGYISSRPVFTGYWDVTPDQQNTLHPNMQRIVKEFGKDPLEVTMYVNLLSQYGASPGFPTARNNYLAEHWEPMLRFKPDIDFKYVYYYDIKKGDSIWYKQYPHKTIRQIAALMADANDIRLSLFKTPEEIHKIIDLEPEDYRLVLHLQYKGRSVFLRTFSGGGGFWPYQTQIAAAFKRLLQDTIPKVYFVTGNYERDIYKSGEREYEASTSDKHNHDALASNGFDVDTVSLDNRDVPGDAIIIALADPKSQLSDTAMARLRRYIDRGGNMLIAGEPGKQEMLNPLLRTLGVQLLPGMIVAPSRNEKPDMVYPYAADPCMDLTEGFLGDLKAARKEKDYDDTFKILMPGMTGFSIDNGAAFTVKPLMMTPEEGNWLKQGSFPLDSAAPVYNPAAGDVKGPFTTAISLTRQVNGRQQRIVACGDADFMSNVRDGGGSLFTALYCWLDDNKFPIYTPYTFRNKDDQFLIGARTANLLIIIYVWALPALLLLIGTLLLIRRKRK